MSVQERRDRFAQDREAGARQNGTAETQYQPATDGVDRARPACVPPPPGRLSTRPVCVPPPARQQEGSPHGELSSPHARQGLQQWQPHLGSPYGNHTSRSADQGRAAEGGQYGCGAFWPSHGVWTPAQLAGYQAWVIASPEWQSYSGSHSLPCKIDKAMSSGRLHIQTLKGIKTQVTDLYI